MGRVDTSYSRVHNIIVEIKEGIANESASYVVY